MPEGTTCPGGFFKSPTRLGGLLKIPEEENPTNMHIFFGTSCATRIHCNLQLQHTIINTLFPQLFNHTLSLNVTYFLTSMTHNREKLTIYSSNILPQTLLIAERVMESSLKIPPLPPADREF